MTIIEEIWMQSLAKILSWDKYVVFIAHYLDAQLSYSSLFASLNKDELSLKLCTSMQCKLSKVAVFAFKLCTGIS